MTRDEGVFVGATRTGATRTAGLKHAELGQRDWDMCYRDNLFVFNWPTVLSVEPMVQYVVCLSVCHGPRKWGGQEGPGPPSSTSGGAIHVIGPSWKMPN